MVEQTAFRVGSQMRQDVKLMYSMEFSVVEFKKEANAVGNRP